MDKSLLLLGTTHPRWTAAGINFLTQDEIAIFLIAYRHGLSAYLKT